MDKFRTLPKRWILVRGLTRSHFHWFDFKDKFKSELNLDQLDCPELPGNGYLFDQNSPTSLKKAVLSLKKQIKDISEPVGLVGLSMGGMIATQWALDFPQEIGKLVLINSSFTLSPFYQRLQPSVYPELFKCLLNPKADNIEKFIFQKTCNTQNWNPVFELSTRFQLEHPVSIKNFIRQLLITRQSRFYKAPKCAIQLLVAQGDRLVSPKCTMTIARQWGLTAAIHQSAGHDLPMDDSQWIIDQIKKG